MNDQVPVARKLEKHWVYQDAEYLKVWITMLFRARYLSEPKKDMYQGVLYILNRGEFIFGRKRWSQELDIGEQKLRTLIKKLIKDEMIKEVCKTNKFTIYSLTNFEKYNQRNNQQFNHQQSVENTGFVDDTNHESNQQITTSQPTDNHQLTTNKESKEGDKNVKKVIYTSDFEDFYKLYPNPWNKHQSFKNFKSLLKSGETVENIMKATTNYIRYLRRNGTAEKQYIVRSTNFVGQHQEYKAYLEIEIQQEKEKSVNEFDFSNM